MMVASPMPDTARQSTLPPVAQTAERLWPGTSRIIRKDEADLPVMDERDQTAWAVPYTDLTMLLMVFFIVKLSMMDPNPPRSAETPLQPDDPSGIAAEVQRTGPSALAGMQEGRGDPSPVRGRTGVLQRQTGLLPNPEPATPIGIAEQTEAVEATAPPADPWTNTQPASAPTPPDLPGDSFDAEWARRVQDLEKSAAAFLSQTSLNGQIDLTATPTGIELRLPDEVLFDSGSASMRDAGADLLSRVAVLLKRIDGDIQIAGHTDNVPIRTTRFPSNWELSASRAIEVVRLLRDLGVPETRLEAVGHGDNRPIASNRTPEGRAINRRVTVEISPPL